MGTVDRLRRVAIQQGDVVQRFPHLDLSNPLFRAALEYASNGLCVFPLKERGKIPIVPKELGGSGYLDATTDPEQIRRWWARYPKANIGIATRASGVVVLDVDPRNGGDETLAKLESKNGELPQTVESITGSGGRHIFFSAPEPDNVQRKTGAFGLGVDCPNYVVAPPSTHPDTGREYAWDAGLHPEDIPFTPLPEWMVAWNKASTPALAESSHDNLPKPNRVSRRTEEFIATGAPIGQQRWRALAATRNLLGSGLLPSEVAALVWSGLRASAQEEHRRAWSFKDALRMATDLAAHPPKNSSSLHKDVPTSRTPPYIRDVGTFGEQDVSRDLEHEAPPLSVARQAAALAGDYRNAAIRGFPQVPGGFVKGGSKAVRRKDDHLHLAIHSGSSDTWQEPNNAALKRRTVYQFYSPLLWDIVERLNMGAVYQFRYHLSPETVKEDAQYTSNLHSRIRRHHGNYVDFLIQEEDGWWVHTFADYADTFGNTEPTVAAQDDFLGWLQGLGPPDAEYRRRYPVMASKEWKMPKSRTHEWEGLGSRATPDILHYKDIEDREDAEAAIQRGIATWVASEQEVMGRAPEDISYTRHFQGGEGHTAKSMLSFLKNDLGFFLYPKAMAELEAPEPNTAPWDHQKVAPLGTKQARLAV